MKKAILAAILVAASSAALAEDDFEGTYASGSTTIEWRAGGRLGTEFISNLCPHKKFRPRTHASASHEGKDYTIKSDDKFTRLDVTGANKCLPRGSYHRVR